MLKSQLSGRTVIVTGTSKTSTVLDDIRLMGGEAYAYPLIETSEIIEPHDHLFLEMAQNLDWLIFTSQNAVGVFNTKLKRARMEAINFNCKIAAVGSKTAKLLEQYGFQVQFMPSIFSADVFVREFPLIAGENPRCLFIRGSKAKDTLKKGLPFVIKEWTVYETNESTANIETLAQLIQTKEEPILIFASPSAVGVFAKHIAPIVGWTKPKLAAIGHITEQAIKQYGAHVTYKPTIYTMQSVLEEIVKREDSKL